MEKKGSDLNQIKTELAVLSQSALHLNEKLDDIKKTMEKYTSDYEDRLRKGEMHRAELVTDIASLNDKMKVFNLIQGALTAIAAIVTYYFAKVQ